MSLDQDPHDEIHQDPYRGKPRVYDRPPAYRKPDLYGGGSALDDVEEFGPKSR